MKDIKFLIVDLFCGAGGTTTGFMNSQQCMVIACVNHDANATALIKKFDELQSKAA